MRGRNIGWCEGSDRVPERPFVRVITVKPFAPLRGVILSQQVQQVLTHYIPNPARPNLFQTQPHWLPASSCPGCLMNRPTRRKGYLGLLLEGRKTGAVIAELTAEAMRGCPALYELAGQLRGHPLTLERLDRQRNSKLRAILSPEVKVAELPPPPDIRFELMRLWGLGAEELNDRWAGWIEPPANGALEAEEGGGE